MRKTFERCGRACALLLCMSVFLAGCSGQSGGVALQIPRGYAPILEIDLQGKLLRVGPFVGYYFRPEDPDDLSRLKFVCFNERSFYTLDLPENAKLFEGDAVLATLPETGFSLPRGQDRIHPVFFDQAPAEWLATRPEPPDEFVHFHSCYDSAGPVLHGYWLRHFGTAEFTYDMGGRVSEGSPLYHQVRVGIDKDFPRIVEFDKGPGPTGRLADAGKRAEPWHAGSGRSACRPIPLDFSSVSFAF